MMEENPVFPMMKHTELINYLARKIKAENYLEIGVHNHDHNFNRINVPGKVGVDPDPEVKTTYLMTSDEYFYFNDNSRVYDLIFIDGLHHAEQVREDIINAWACLHDGGCLIIHDTNPHLESITHVPRDSGEWTGDVYKAIHQIDGPPKFTLKDDYGVTVIRKTGQLTMSKRIIEWEEFNLSRQQILNLVSWDEAINIIDGWA